MFIDYIYSRLSDPKRSHIPIVSIFYKHLNPSDSIYFLKHKGFHIHKNIQILITIFAPPDIHSYILLPNSY